MNVLCIGNSFSQDATRYLHQVSGESLFVRNLYIGGCSLERHYNNIVEDRADYEYQKNGRCLKMISIKEALKKIVTEAKDGKISEDEITETTLQNYLNTKNYPDPDLLIRTGGEHRISNFLLWQIAYTELYFTQKLWPDFRKADLIEAIADYQGRQRRFGKTGDQIIENNNK